MWKSIQTSHAIQNRTGQVASSSSTSLVDCAVSLRWLLNFSRTVPAGYTTADVVAKLIIPKTEQNQCRFVNTVSGKSVGRVHSFVSHAWSCDFKELVGSLEGYFKGQLASGPAWDIFLWLDIFAISQHGAKQGKEGLDGLGAVVTAAEATLLVLDSKGACLNRIW